MIFSLVAPVGLRAPVLRDSAALPGPVPKAMEWIRSPSKSTELHNGHGSFACFLFETAVRALRIGVRDIVPIIATATPKRTSTASIARISQKLMEGNLLLQLIFFIPPGPVSGFAEGSMGHFSLCHEKAFYIRLHEHGLF